MFKCPCAVGRLTSLMMLCVAADTGGEGEEGAAKGTEPASRQKVSREEEERGQECTKGISWCTYIYIYVGTWQNQQRCLDVDRGQGCAEGISWCIYCTVILCRYVAKSTALFRDGLLYCRCIVSVIVVVLGHIVLLLLL